MGYLLGSAASHLAALVPSATKSRLDTFDLQRAQQTSALVQNHRNFE
jgi:hypothetical protein